MNEKKDEIEALENILERLQHAPCYEDNSVIDPYHHEMKFINTLKSDVLARLYELKLK